VSQVFGFRAIPAIRHQVAEDVVASRYVQIGDVLADLFKPVAIFRRSGCAIERQYRNTRACAHTVPSLPEAVDGLWATAIVFKK
jgi:hypothetical protein